MVRLFLGIRSKNRESIMNDGTCTLNSRKTVVILLASLALVIQNGRAAIDKSWLVETLKHFESKTKNYVADFDDVYVFEDPRWLDHQAKMFGTEDEKRTKTRSFHYVWETGKWRSEKLVLNAAGQPQRETWESQDDEKWMFYVPQIYNTQGNDLPRPGLVQPKKQKDVHVTPNTFMLVSKSGKGLSSIVEQPHTKVDYGVYGGEQVIVCEYQEGPTKRKVYLDPNKDFSIVCTEVYKPNGTLYRIRDNIVHRKLSEGIWFPVTGDSTLYVENENGSYKAQVLRMTVNEKTLKINQNLAENIFQIEFPHGTIVKDSILGLQYQVGAHRTVDKLLEDMASENDVILTGNSRARSEHSVRIISEGDNIKQAQSAPDATAEELAPNPNNVPIKKADEESRAVRSKFSTWGLAGLVAGLTLVLGVVSIKRRNRKGAL
jgi:hypothetical protein